MCRLLVTCVLLLGSAAIAVADDLPRYSLPVGRKLVYTSSSDSKSADGKDTFSSTGSTQVTVLRSNPDGSAHLLIRSAAAYKQGGQAQPEEVELSQLDVFPNGQVVVSDPMAMMWLDASFLPVLPKNGAELGKGWSYTNEPRQVTTSFTVAESKPTALVFTGTEGGPLSRIYVTTQKSTYHFDTAKGMVTAIETEQTQDYGFHTKGTGKITLQSDETLPADTVAQLAADAEALFAAKKQYQATMAAMEKSNEPVADQLLAAGRLLDSAAAAAKTEDVKKEFAKLRERLNDSAEDAGREAKDRNPILNKPAAAWEATDIDGHPVKLADFKGKVVVMDFWYRGCGWCMYATPQVKQLAADYKDKPVTVLGMNTDRDEKDARLVIDVMGITYPTIKSTGIPEKYGIHGFPTLVVVDPVGVVRHIHVGYSPTLRQDVGKVIDQLLAGDKNAATP